MTYTWMVSNSSREMKSSGTCGGTAGSVPAEPRPFSGPQPPPLSPCALPLRGCCHGPVPASRPRASAAGPEPFAPHLVGDFGPQCGVKLAEEHALDAASHGGTRSGPSTGCNPAPPAAVAPLPRNHTAAHGAGPHIERQHFPPLSGGAALRGRALVLTDSPPQPIGARTSARPCRRRGSARPANMALTAETESRLYRSLRVAAGAAAHLVALGFPAAVAVLARPGSSECRWVRGRGEGRMSHLTSPHPVLPFQVCFPGTLCSWPSR